MKKGFKLISAFLVSFMIMMSSVMPAFADETDTSTTGDLLDKIQERGELIVGTSPDFPPNEFIDSTKTGQAQYVGSDIELAKYIAKKMGVKLTIKAASFDTVLANLQTEEIDLAITGLAYTPARAQQMEMSIGYNMTEDTGGQAVIIAKKDADKGKVQEIRDYVKSVQGFRQVELTAREQNYGLAKNVIEGVTAIVNKYGKVIVLEDDLVTNRYFLLFMNDGLDRYQNEQKVTGITGFSHFGDTFSYPCESYFNTLSGTSWSWATWSDRWKYFDADCDDWTDMVSDKKLRKAFNYDNTYDFYKIMKMQKTDEKTNSWAIRWYWTNFRKQGLILSPTKSLVSNEGWDGTGIHCGNEKGPVFDHKLMTDHRITEFPQEICEKPELHKAMKKALIHESQPNLIKRIYHVVFRKNYIGQA